MVGVLLREGVNRSQPPTVELISLGAKNPVRHASDLLPYLPKFRQFFSPLPTEAAEMELKILKIPLSDVTSVTGTTVQSRGPTWTLAFRRGTYIQLKLGLMNY